MEKRNLSAPGAVIRLLCLLTLCLLAASPSAGESPGGLGPQLLTPPPPRPAPGRPVEVALHLTLNKISEIDTVEETYRVDAYLTATWKDPEGARKLLRDDEERAVILGERGSELLGTELWGPDLELINNIGSFEVPDMRLEAFGDGKLSFVVRFQATLSANMDFRQYPFDQQTFKVHVESFTYAAGDMVFIRPEAEIGHMKETPSPDWTFGSPVTQVSQNEYTDGTYSRYSVSLEGKRRPGYFIWQVFLPLFLILGTSWIVFWLDGLSEQISVAFTCMLTIVAFNFYTSTLLPQLPYNTFIEAVIISAYAMTFALIGYILLAYRLGAKRSPEAERRFERVGRWLFPLAYLLSLALIVAGFF